MELRAWIGNLAHYNEGKLTGDWIDLEDLSEDEIWDAIRDVTQSAEEYYIGDSEPIRLPEYMSISNVARIANLDCDPEIFQAIWDTVGNSYLDNAIQIINDGEYMVHEDKHELCIQAMGGEHVYDNLPSIVRHSLDWDKMIYTLEIEMTLVGLSDGSYLEIWG